MTELVGIFMIRKAQLPLQGLTHSQYCGCCCAKQHIFEGDTESDRFQTWKATYTLNASVQDSAFPISQW